jgi:hypothetical protein
VFLLNKESKSKYFSGLKANDYRVEYSSAHLGKGGSLCFSPNNMKLIIDIGANVGMFTDKCLEIFGDGLKRGPSGQIFPR